MDNPQENYTQVLLEDIRSQFKAFGENLELVKEKGDATHEQVGTLSEKLEAVKVKTDATYEKVGELAEDVDTIKVEIISINEELKKNTHELAKHSELLDEHTTILHEHSEELRMIRYDLKEKVGRDELKALENRVLRLEKLTLQSSH